MRPISRFEVQVGSFIGRYRLVERIGGGVTTHVFTAYDESADQTVALKIRLPPSYRTSRKRASASTARPASRRRSGHPNIVSVLDVGEDAGRPFIVMELLKGLPLGEYLEANPPVEVKTLVDLVMQLYQGLQAAHEHGVVHRDVKPSNCFVQDDGVLKILDFGLARLHASTLTASGAHRRHAGLHVAGAGRRPSR